MSEVSIYRFHFDFLYRFNYNRYRFYLDSYYMFFHKKPKFLDSAWNFAVVLIIPGAKFLFLFNNDVTLVCIFQKNLKYMIDILPLN